jgi:hypothetical protein
MTWVLIVGLAWLAVAAVAALAIARAIHVADEKQRRSVDVVVLVEDDPHVPLRSTDELAVAAGDGAVPPPRTAADGGSPRLRGRRNVVRNPVASSERTPHTHKSGAL